MKTLFSTQKLLNWFEKNQRSLPWRQQYNPYQVWVSEVMLQQTRVDQMLSYYKRFLKQFPSIQALAQAREETVLKSWEGLGYYARARNLHKAAQQIVSNYNGKMPSTKEELKKLPGFGDYIASAVSSIAFNQSNAVVDGNVFRVIARFFGIQSDIANAKTKQEFQSIAEKILPPKKSRYFN
ncbi:A/G-specific adenine glycosylase, partial [Candidatus Micrarchaeota archaeon]|nr:A/G-specific adenine glycosylase [Candidatus Micrarchaeota archaeon]